MKMTPTKNNPRYANGNLRRKHRARLRAMGCECGICHGRFGPIHYDEPSDAAHAVNEGQLTWYRPQQALRESAVTSIKRPIGGGYGFGGDNSLPVEACALALWGAKTSRRDPTRKMRIG